MEFKHVRKRVKIVCGSIGMLSASFLNTQVRDGAFKKPLLHYILVGQLC